VGAFLRFCRCEVARSMKGISSGLKSARQTDRLLQVRKILVEPCDSTERVLPQ
jgi:hypothetical protein